MTLNLSRVIKRVKELHKGDAELSVESIAHDFVTMAFHDTALLVSKEAVEIALSETQREINALRLFSHEAHDREMASLFPTLQHYQKVVVA